MQRITVPVTSYPLVNHVVRSLLSPKRLDVNEFVKPYLLNGQKSHLFSRSSWALAYLCKLFMRLSFRDNMVIFVPGYFCNTVLFPLRELPVKIIFYPITESLEPDWEKIDCMTKSVKPDIFLLVHYFGFQNAVKEAADFCPGHDCLLVEDGAHVLVPYGDIGKYCWAYFLSSHKLMPVPDGSILSMKSEVTNEFFDVKDEEPEDFEIFLTGRAKSRRSHCFKWMTKRLLQRFLDLSGMGWFAKQDMRNEQTEIVPDDIQNEFEISDISKKLIGFYTESIEEITDTRRRNYKFYIENMFSKNNGLRPLCSHLPPGAAPYTFGILSDELKANRFHTEMNKFGIPVQSWPDLPPEVYQQPKLYPNALDLFKKVNFLPVHQSISPRHLTKIAGLGRRLV